MTPVKPQDLLDLLDWKRAIFDLYREIRASSPQDGWEQWRHTRDALFKSHPQSPIPYDERQDFEGIHYYDYDPTMRVTVEIHERIPETYEIPTSGNSPMHFTRFGAVALSLSGEPVELELYWLDAYGGGIFLPFRDATSGSGTYGAGRYLLDTVKGADLGMEKDRIVLDFNFAYNPSCAYDPVWVCPLAPPANRLAIPIRAGEKAPAGPTGSN